jgi:hypothetical protein
MEIGESGWWVYMWGGLISDSSDLANTCSLFSLVSLLTMQQE